MISAFIAIIVGACVGVWFVGKNQLTMEALPAAVIGAIGGFLIGWLFRSVIEIIPFGSTIMMSVLGAAAALLLFTKLTQR